MNILHVITDAATSRRGKFVTIALWLVLLAVLMGIAPKLASYYDNSGTAGIPADAPSQAAQRLLLKEFPGSRGVPAILVFYHKGGLGTDDLTQTKTVSDWLVSDQKPASVDGVVSIYTVPQAASELLSQDKTTMTMAVTMHGTTQDAAFQKSVKDIRAYLASQATNAGLQAYLTGPAGVTVDAIFIFQSVDVRLLLATVGLVLVLLIVLYRSPILALLPLIGVGWALQIVDALLAYSGKAGLFSISQQATSIMTVLLFGAGTDYTIFIASRFREELFITRDKHEAMRLTMRAVGEAIASSAGTVIAALCTLIFTAIGLYSSLGPTLIIAVAVMLVAGLTLVPALLVWLGRAAYWPFVPRYAVEHLEQQKRATLHGFWGFLGNWTAHHRILATVGSLALLGVLALGNIGSLPTYNFLTVFRNPTDSISGYQVLQDHFPAGTLAPTTVLVQLKGTQSDAYQYLTQLDAVNAALEQVPGVATVRGPTRPDGNVPAIEPAKLQALIASLPPQLRAAIRSGQQTSGTAGTCQGAKCPPVDPQLAAAIGLFAASSQYVSPANTTVQFSVILKDDPYSLTAINRIDPMRTALNTVLKQQGLAADGFIAGQTATLSDTQGYNQHDTWLVVPAVLLLVGVILALLLRSLVAPLYLLGAVTLNFVATLGLCGFFFQHIEGQDGFNYAIPLYTFIFLVALGADYTIFLMSRVREEAQLRGLEEGVPYAVSRTGGVITSAGLILAGTFAVLTTLPINILYQFGVCVAVGILMDTLLVRGLLVPGLVLLLGKWNWWPGRLRSLPVDKAVDEPVASEA